MPENSKKIYILTFLFLYFLVIDYFSFGFGIFLSSWFVGKLRGRNA